MLDESVKSISSVGAWSICIVLLLATLLNYMDRQVLAVTLPTLKAKYQLAEARIGRLEGTFGMAFAAGSLFFGLLADRMGPRFLYPAVLAGWSLAGIATSMAGRESLTQAFESASESPGTGVFRWLLICRLMLGFCEAGHWPCALITIRSILSPRDRTLGNGILQSGASLGAIIVPIYVEASDRAGNSWEFPFWSIGLVGLLWIPLWFAVVGVHRLSPRVEHHESASTTMMADTSTHLVRRLLVLFVIVATLTISWQFLRAWLALFLQDHHGYSKEATRGLMSGYFIAADIGCLASGGLVAMMVHRGWPLPRARTVGFFLFAMLTACGALVPRVSDDRLMVGLLFLAGAGILGLHPFYYAMTQELPPERLGFFTGLLAAGGWIVSSLSQIFLGQHIQATQSYALGLSIVGLAPMIGLAAMILFWPRTTVSNRSLAV
ncbi:MFS transporter [bacterium]|jgi:MFS transporter, ACS family, hexuronate transporter|nr:MFS transporter [bacterium]